MTSPVVSFQKKVKNKVPNIPGTKPSIHNAQLLVSTGIPSLDFVIGGGLPVGTIILVEEDTYKSYSRILLKYFLAEGIVNKQSLFVASQDENPSLLVSDLPHPLNSDSDLQQMNEVNKATSQISLTKDNNPEMKIAWRYEKCAPVNTNLESQNIFGHFYDLSKPMDKEIIKNSNIGYWNGESSNVSKGTFSNPKYMDLLLKIENRIKSGNFSTTYTANNAERSILRVGIQSLASPFWLSQESLGSNLHEDLCLFLYCLRALIRSAYAVAMITVPAHLFNQTEYQTIPRLTHLVDTCVNLESFVGSDRETNPIFKDYHGLFHVKKLSAINSLAPHSLQTYDLAFKLRRKKFCIEKLHLPPELQESAEREQDDVPASLSCVSNKKHLLEF